MRPGTSSSTRWWTTRSMSIPTETPRATATGSPRRWTCGRRRPTVRGCSGMAEERARYARRPGAEPAPARGRTRNPPRTRSPGVVPHPIPGRVPSAVGDQPLEAHRTGWAGSCRRQRRDRRSSGDCWRGSVNARRSPPVRRRVDLQPRAFTVGVTCDRGPSRRGGRGFAGRSPGKARRQPAATSPGRPGDCRGARSRRQRAPARIPPAFPHGTRLGRVLFAVASAAGAGSAIAVGRLRHRSSSRSTNDRRRRFGIRLAVPPTERSGVPRATRTACMPNAAAPSMTTNPATPINEILLIAP